MRTGIIGRRGQGVVILRCGILRFDENGTTTSLPYKNFKKKKIIARANVKAYECEFRFAGPKMRESQFSKIFPINNFSFPGSNARRGPRRMTG